MGRLALVAMFLGAAAGADEARPRLDSRKVAELKRRKLATRDEIALLEAGQLTRN